MAEAHRDRTDPPADAVPDIVCTLTTKQLATRALEWSDLGDLALGRELLADGVVSTYDAEHFDAIRDLVGREQSCCGSWLDARAELHDGSVRLSLTTSNPDGLGIIRSMAGVREGDQS